MASRVRTPADANSCSATPQSGSWRRRWPSKSSGLWRREPAARSSGLTSFEAIGGNTQRRVLPNAKTMRVARRNLSAGRCWAQALSIDITHWEIATCARHLFVLGTANWQRRPSKRMPFYTGCASSAVTMRAGSGLIFERPRLASPRREPQIHHRTLISERPSARDGVDRDRLPTYGMHPRERVKFGLAAAEFVHYHRLIHRSAGRTV
jgi:hypothetical protein